MSYILRSARFLAADALNRFLQKGDTVVDATVGNGHDTLMLAELVGSEGKVYGFDIQPEAIERAKSLLTEAGFDSVCELHAVGHEHMAEVVQGPMDAVVFNLGWLPGGDKSVTTRWETTQIAVQTALRLLRPMGLCSVCVYPGHAEGDHERSELAGLFAALSPREYNVLHHVFLNAGPGAPECYLIQKQDCHKK